MSDGPTKVRERAKFRLLMFPVDLYAAFMAAYLFLRVFTTGHVWPIELISVGALWLLLLAVFLLPIALWMQRWPTAALLGVSAMAFLLLFGGMLLPKHVDRVTGVEKGYAQTLVVMTFNISNGIASPDSLVKVIGESGADIVAVQEFTQAQAAGLQDGLQTNYPYQAFYDTGIAGIGLITRYPIIKAERFFLQGIHPYLVATIEAQGAPLTVVVAHPPVTFGPGAPQAPHRADIQALGRLAIEGGPTIVMGDFNFTDQNEGYDSLKRAGLIDVFRAAGWGFGLTYPKRTWSGKPARPLVRLDYIWVTIDFVPLKAWVGKDGGSDHLPVLAVLGR